MAIFVASAASLACAFYVYVFIQFVRDDVHVSRGLSTRPKSSGRLRDCTSH
jgi:hypothetical protein